MKHVKFSLLILMVFLLTTSSDISAQNIAIAIHGGAGTIKKEYMTDSLELEYTKALEEAVSAGYDILENGGTSLEAVTTAIVLLEDSPLFNAGKGAVFTYEGANELDASIMDGATRNAGAVTGVKTVKNPILLAEKVMSGSPHVMLSGVGAEEFAREQGVETVEPDYFFTEERYQASQRAKQRGTVGAVALDRYGNLAAGTSTGGMTNKRWGRIGDSPVIGAGTYANNDTCAVSATGWGEFFIRGVVAYDISALLEYKNLSLRAAVREVIRKKLPELGGDGGVIAIDSDGNITMEFNTPGMYRAAIDMKGKRTVAMYGE